MHGALVCMQAPKEAKVEEKVPQPAEASASAQKPAPAALEKPPSPPPPPAQVFSALLFSCPVLLQLYGCLVSNQAAALVHLVVLLSDKTLGVPVMQQLHATMH